MSSSTQTKNIPALFIILFVALILRLFGINWDDGWHLHPDERMLIMVAEKIDFFSNLDPDFFNYGSLPVYLLKGTADLVSFFSRTPPPNYNSMLQVGRTLSVLFDCLTVLFIYKISRKLLSHETGALLASFLYGLAFFPIQNTHFFIVDPLLTMFITISLYMLIRYMEQPGILKLAGVALFSAGAITTKFTGILFLPIAGVGLVISHLLLYFSGEARIHRPSGTVTNLIFGLISHGLFFAGLYIFFAFLLMPYGFINREQFIKEISLQLTMNSDPFIFPYTLQYVGTTSYWYYIKHIFLWGLGPVISLLSLFGLVGFMRRAIYVGSQSKSIQSHLSNIKPYVPAVLCTAYFILHFAIIGRSAVKFMRYMLPLYPYLAILAGYGLFRISKQTQPAGRYICIFFLLLTAFWSFMFISIYRHPHTRLAASEWIYEHVESGSTIAVEHWDDQLPLPLPGNNWPSLHASYQVETLELYNPDTPQKWQTIDTQLENSDYLVIASNRLYIPLQKLTDCKNLPEHRCYATTADYYQKLFNEQTSFRKVAEFSSYPGIHIGQLTINIQDDYADESFTVYDHPKVMIFENVK